MKLSTRKIIGIEVGVVLAWLGFLFVPNTVLREYLQVAGLAVAVLVGWWLLGWAKPRATEGKLATMLIVLSALVFQVLWFVFLGLKLGFVQNVYAWNWSSFINIFLPVVLMIVLEEIWRGQMILKGHESRLVVVLTAVVCVVLDTIWMWRVYDVGLAKEAFELAMLVAFPSLLKSCLLSYVAYVYDYRANIGYRLIMELPIYVLPILPNVNEYLTVMFSVGLIVVLTCLMVRMRRGRTVEQTKIEKPEEDGAKYRKRLVRYGVLGVFIVAVVAYVGLMSGLFKYHLLAIGSGSMEPAISRGDMVLVEKTQDYDDMEVGDVLVYRHSNVVMIHRISEISEQDGVFTFQTKGDANESMDKWVVTQGDVIGVAKGKMAMFGYPTLWLNELFNGGKS